MGQMGLYFYFFTVMLCETPCVSPELFVRHEEEPDVGSLLP